MKNLLIKYLYLSYTSKLFGQIGRMPRAATVIVPVFCFAIIMHETVTAIGGLTWMIFGGLILLTFPIVKSRLINTAGLVAAIGLSIASIWYDHNWYEPLVFLYFALGFLVDKTRFVFPLKYEELQDWEQKHQYLSMPYEMIKNDETVPTGLKFAEEFKDLQEDYENKYKGDEKFVEADTFLFPIIVGVLTLIIYSFVGSGF